MLGEKSVLQFARSQNVTLAEISEKLLDLEKQEDLVYEILFNRKFAKFPIKFKSKKWSLDIARVELTSIMSSLGFGKGGTKKYGNIEDIPEGWPQEDSFENFKHASKTRLNDINLIIESILSPYGFSGRPL